MKGYINFGACLNSGLMLLIMSALSLAGATAFTVVRVKTYRLEETSKLYLKGTSNVNAFTCECQERYQENTIEAEINGGHVRFRRAELLMRPAIFNCHNRKIEADLQKALKADQYPTLRVALTETWIDPKCLEGGCTDWFDVSAKVQITLAGNTRNEHIAAKAKSLGNNRFQISGSKALQMTAFGVTPPEAMFGMIKVNDWINFHFDLSVAVRNNS